ncbi:hypothetical protein MAR_038222 [Mya arenaria]|uniref:Uncharacterized protein n=1 Tax=Mya arenaria TaxID=6604 RepID=A0ABY7FQQ3_MYAAR|nr:hypothetical protein MAR_038222 [Mya arenaria]
MKEEASKVKTLSKSFSGRISIDEMSIQEDFCMSKENGGYRKIGFIDNDEYCQKINAGKWYGQSILPYILSSARNSIVPSRVNSDELENVFYQQRGICNGKNTNPIFYQYLKNMNSVLLGKQTVSKKCKRSQNLMSTACV